VLWIKPEASHVLSICITLNYYTPNPTSAIPNLLVATFKKYEEIGKINFDDI
jgi:hypothetical protein